MLGDTLIPSSCDQSDLKTGLGVMSILLIGILKLSHLFLFSASFFFLPAISLSGLIGWTVSICFLQEHGMENLEESPIKF